MVCTVPHHKDAGLLAGCSYGRLSRVSDIILQAHATLSVASSQKIIFGSRLQNVLTARATLSESSIIRPWQPARTAAGTLSAPMYTCSFKSFTVAVAGK